MKITTIVGARPQFIKAAAISRAISRRSGIEEAIIHTGQHFDANMSDVFFSELKIPQPLHNLDIHGGAHGAMTGRMLKGIEDILIDEQTDILLIYGDTNSTLAGALAAAKLHIPVAHVEAGLRSFNRAMPEEVNRVVADHLSDLLLCPTFEAIKNLKNEGITAGVHHVGDVMNDATLFARSIALKNSKILERLNLSPGKYSVCTLHRAENTDDIDRLLRLVDFLEIESDGRPMLFPIHPRTKAVFVEHNIQPKHLQLIDPVGYLDMNCLLASATTVYTDSGGLQKEAYFHRVPCVTLREETEWVETINHGWNRLWQTDNYCTPRRDIPEYGDGSASDMIVDLLLAHSANL
ncbi:MAG: UDP-N-acetylglucosamine 2-epimerase (non-hydrolyzing) [Rhodobiaceae bacterium]|nr:MAG: UDP-N-acetylglucosamine 2-epimerase (non-hydrolyzing) [Rhodobiaceae bacterium]